MATVNAGIAGLNAAFLAAILALVIYVVFLLRHHALATEPHRVRFKGPSE